MSNDFFKGLIVLLFVFGLFALGWVVTHPTAQPQETMLPAKE